MPPAGTSTLYITRTSAFGAGGAVAGKTEPGVDAGIAILNAGGNAIDAAVATAFAMSVTEPSANGLGGGGFLVGWLASEQRAFTIEYPMISGSGATEDTFPLSTGVDAGLFGWPSTVGNANVLGYRSIAVPGTVAGLALALERYGTMSLAQVLEHAISLAENGFPVNWHMTLSIAKDLANIRRFNATASLLLNASGNPPFAIEGAPPPLLRNPDLAATLRAIATDGPRAFYEGTVGQALADHLSTNGTPVTAEDFASYQATEADPVATSFAGHSVHTVGKGSGGTSLSQALRILEKLDIATNGHNTSATLHKYAHAFRQAFADRFTYLADPEQVEVPIDALISEEYIASRAARFDPASIASIQPGSRDVLGVRHNLSGSVPEYMKDGSTTHLSVIDAEGNAVAITQTLLSLWGSRVTVPGTGVLMNNGMMWFDPEPGRPNSVGPRKRPLSNMAPAIVTRDGKVRASIGSSGGRKIMNCNAQVIANLAAFGLSMGEALAAPRIDTSTRALNVSSRLGPSVQQELANLGHPVNAVNESLQTGGFASPTGVSRDQDGTLEAASDAWYFPATAKALR
jgi:gamma-glutamyltranspeptidase/glutathione hydrolase